MPNDYKVIGLDATNGRPIVPSSTDTLTIPGNLVVQGTTTTIDSEIATADRSLLLNSKYTSDAVANGMIIFNVDPSTTAQVDGSDGSTTVNFNSTTQVTVTGEFNSNYTAGKFLLVSGSENGGENDGLYEVASSSYSAPNTVITIDTSPTIPGSVRTAFVVNNDDDSCMVSLTKVGILQTDSANGTFKQMYGDNTGVSFTTLLHSGQTIEADSVAADDISRGDAAVTIDTSSGDIQIGATNLAGGINLISNEADAAAITLKNQNAAGGIDIDSGTGGIAVDSTGALSLDAATSSNLTMAANTGSTQTLTIAASNADGSNVANIDVDADGTVDIDGAAGINIGKNADVAIDIDSAALDIDSSGAITIDGTSTLSIDSQDDSNLTVTASGKDLDIAVAGGSTQELRLASAGTGASALHLNASAGGVDIDSADMITLDAADEITLTTTSADGHISLVTAHTAGVAFHLDANADAGSIVDIDAGILDIDVTGAASFNSAAYTLDSSAGMSLDAVDDSNLTVTGAAKDLDIAVAGGGTQELRLASAGTGAEALTLTASAGGIQLVCDTAAKDIMLAADGVQIVRGFTAGANLAAGDIVYLQGSDQKLEKCDADSIDSSIFLGVALSSISEDANGNLAVSGIVRNVTSDTSFSASSHIGQPVYISVTAGKISPNVPSGSGDVVYKVGICVDGSGTAWEVLLQPALVSVLG